MSDAALKEADAQRSRDSIISMGAGLRQAMTNTRQPGPRPEIDPEAFGAVLARKREELGRVDDMTRPQLIPAGGGDQILTIGLFDEKRRISTRTFPRLAGPPTLLSQPGSVLPLRSSGGPRPNGDQQRRQRRGGNALQSRGGAERGRPGAGQPFDHFGTEAANRRIVQIFWQADCFIGPKRPEPPATCRSR